MIDFSKVAAVIRSYNNAAVVKQVKALRSFLSYILVVTDAKKDRGATKAWLEELNDPCVELIEIAEGYTWANALNRALDHIQLFNARFTLGFRNPLEYVFNVSVEARFEKHHLGLMLAQFHNQKNIGVVGTSFLGQCEGNRVDLGLSYRHPRNTGMLIRLLALDNRMVRDFDGFCDDIGGMEDIDFVCRMEVFSELRATMLDLKVPLIVGKHYNQADKERREREAMKKIFDRYKLLSKRITEVAEKFS